MERLSETDCEWESDKESESEAGSASTRIAMLPSRNRSPDSTSCPREALASASTSESEAGTAVWGGVGSELKVRVGFGIETRVSFALRRGALALAVDSEYSEPEPASDSKSGSVLGSASELA